MSCSLQLLVDGWAGGGAPDFGNPTHACKALAQIRKLLGPNIQINVAEQQVNVMS